MAGLGNIFGNFNVGKIMNVAGTVGMVIVVAVICLLLLWVIFYVLKYNKKTLLIQMINGQMRFSMDVGFKNKKKREFSVMKHRNIDFIYPDSMDESPYGNKGSIIPYVVINQQASPIKGINDDGNFILADMNMFNHLAGRLKKNEELTRGKVTFWDRYGRDILLVTMMTILFLSIIFILKRVDNAIEMGRSIVSLANSERRQVVTNSLPLLLTLAKRKKK